MADSKYDMYQVYILLLSNGDLYKGYTEDIERRVQEHQTGKVESTRDFRPVSLVLYECYKTKSDAERRERFLKTNEGRVLLRRQIADTLRDAGAYEKYKKLDAWNVSGIRSQGTRSGVHPLINP